LSRNKNKQRNTMKNRNRKKQGKVAPLALAGVMVAGQAGAQDALRTLEPLTVVGGDDEVFQLPGSGAYVSAEDFRERGYTNLTQIAAKVPSVFVRDEDGYGNFPNISLRGVDGTRSSKVTLMEDGILTAPSTYSAPAAYYSPKAGRMSAIEFLKGSSQVKYGPHTTGGVVNYLSTPIPGEGGPNFFSRTTYGTDNTFFNHTWYGDTQTTEAGTFGYLLELHTMTTDGFRDIDGSSKDSGFDLIEPMLKLFYEPNTALKQRFEFKFGYTDFDANESYSGLTDGDLRANPNRRYAASQFDHHTAEQFRTYLKWIAEPSDDLRIESAAYFNSFERNWDKLDGLRTNGGPALVTNVGQALLHGPSLAVLQGTGVGDIFTRDAFRDHESYGWQNQVNYRFDTGSVSHDVAVGLRLHYDRAGGTNQQIFYTSNTLGGFGPAAPGAVGSAGLSEVFSTAIYLEDQIKIGALTLSPGIRYEHLEVENTTAAGVNRSADEQLVMGGIGATYDFDTENSLFGGIYRGASPANPAGYLAGTDSEESLGFELGYRHRTDAFRSELVAFFTDYSQLIAPEVGVGGGGLSPSTNGGSAESWGLEALVEYDAGLATNTGLSIPIYLSATYTQAEFSGISGARLGNGSGLYAGAANGNDVPYIPEWKLATGVSVIAEKWGVNLDASFTTSTWGTGYNGGTRLDDLTDLPTTPTAVDGKIDALFLVDLTGHYMLNDNFKLVGGIQNIFDTQKIVSRAPLGPRANAPRMIFGGIEATF
jgi:Fe(3+) dicitrate transport protein